MIAGEGGPSRVRTYVRAREGLARLCSPRAFKLARRSADEGDHGGGSGRLRRAARRVRRMIAELSEVTNFADREYLARGLLSRGDGFYRVGRREEALR